MTELRKFIQDTLRETFVQSMEEDYPVAFNMEHFKSLTSYKNRIEYCNAYLERIGGGSSRIVYKIDDTKVLKLARNRKGLAQNEVELQWGNDSYFDNILAQTIDYDQDDLWIEMELARKVTKSEFRKLSGFDISDVDHYLRNFGNKQKGMRTIFGIDPEIESAMNESDFINNVNDFIVSADMEPADLGKLSSYGIVKRSDGEHLVIIDYGFTEEVRSTYYQPARRMAVYQEQQ